MNSDATHNGIRVPAGTDRFNSNGMSIWGLLPLASKLSGKDTGGDLYIFEHRDQGKGGPPRHVHFEQDEWFYVIKGEYAFEIGGEKSRLRAGDTMFAPRNVPHGWACASDEPGTLLTIVSPVGTFEEFLLETTRHPTLPSQAEVEKAFASHNMKVVGPPLDVTSRLARTRCIMTALIAMHARGRAMLVALSGAVLLTASCGTKEETPPVRIVALDRSFEAPQGIAAGMRHIIFENRGSEIHEAMFVKLPPGMSAEAYVAALKSGSLFPKGAVDYSGPGLTSPGESVELWLKLDPGEYILICWNSGHSTTTRIHQLRVEDVGAKPNRPPKEDVVLKLVDYRFELEGTLRAGVQTVRIETPGPAMHEVDFFRLHDGRTAEDVRHWRKQRGQIPLPGVALGGALDTHDLTQIIYLRRHFAPGRYVLLCQMPVANSDLKHDDMGMVREIEIAE